MASLSASINPSYAYAGNDIQCGPSNSRVAPAGIVALSLGRGTSGSAWQKFSRTRSAPAVYGAFVARLSGPGDAYDVPGYSSHSLRSTATPSVSTPIS